jgi:chromosomal replication initiation ATPase DnaA
VGKCLTGSAGNLAQLTAEDIASTMCLTYNIDEAQLHTQPQQRTVPKARAVEGWLDRELGCVTLSEVGRYVKRDVGSISSAVRRLSERLQDAPELADRVRTLKTLLEKTT